jgi:hypothetical protein
MPHSLRLPSAARFKLPHFLTTRPVAIAAVVAVGLLGSIYIPRSTTQTFDPNCQTWDESASKAVAALIDNVGAEALLADAVFRLKRARNHCRHGFVTLARQDYDALTNGRYHRRQ